MNIKKAVVNKHVERMLLNCGVWEDSWESLGLQSILNVHLLKEISPECSLEGLMLKLKLQYFGHLMQRADSFEKTLMLGKIEGGRRRGWQRMKLLDVITDSMDMSLSGLGVGDGQGSLVCCNPWGHKESDTTERLNWTELNWGRRLYSVLRSKRKFGFSVRKNAL